MAQKHLQALADKWKAEAAAAQAALPPGTHKNAVTQEMMRHLVLQWFVEIYVEIRKED